MRRSMNVGFVKFATACCVLVLFIAPVPGQTASSLEAEFERVAAVTLESMREQGIRTTGVLKFAVRVGSGEFPPHVGRLNVRLAEKLEVALALANPARKSKVDQQVGVIRNASAVASTIEGANHLTDKGRALLFSKTYPLAWIYDGQAETVPDSLIVGAAELSEDLKQLKIELMLVVKEQPNLQTIASLVVTTGIEELICAGENFSTRALGVRKASEDDYPKEAGNTDLVNVIIDQASEIRHGTSEQARPRQSGIHPLSHNSQSPIRFITLYDGAPQPYEFREGAAYVREPREGQRVEFKVQRASGSNDRLGVLVRVNGENTLYRRTRPNHIASLWMFKSKQSAFRIKGFYVNKSTVEKFRVLSDVESVTRAVDYGADTGMISIVVYPERKTRSPDSISVGSNMQLQAKTTLPAKTMASRNELGGNLFSQLASQNATRGMLAGGDSTRIKSLAIREFERADVPIMATSIRYHGR